MIYKRLMNYLIDSFALLIFIVSIIRITGFDKILMQNMKAEDFSASYMFSIVGNMLVLAYYVLSEYYFQKTIGKYITKTKVVSVDGHGLTVKQIIVRTVIRFIPFEAISIISEPGHNTCFHDSYSKTQVIKDNN